MIVLPEAGKPMRVAVEPWLANKQGTKTSFLATYMTATEKAVCVQHAESAETLWIPRSALLQLEPVSAMEIAPEEVEIRDIPITRADIPPWDHQKQAFWFAMPKRGVYEVLWMGCIDGDAEVTVNRAGKGETISLALLHLKFNSAARKQVARDRPIYTYIRGLKSDGTLGKIRVLGTMDKGLRDVVKITLRSGKSLRCTPDHEILTDNGWVKAELLHEGCVVMTNGRFIDKDGYVRVPTPRSIRTSANTGGQYEHILVAEKLLGRKMRAGECVHHINGIKSDNREENLRVFHSNDAHMVSEHLASLKKNLGCFYPREDDVVSVEPDGQARVYDVACEENHNFVANGIIVHNCGKTRVAIDLVVNRDHRRVLIACPRAVIDTWPDEFATWAQGRVLVTPLKEGSISARTKQARLALERAAAREMPAALVINYEAAWQGDFSKFALGDADFDCVIADECHRLKSASGKASMFFMKLGRQTPWKIGLSGTPMPHSPLDIYAQARFLAPRVFGTSNTLFKARYAVMGGFNGKVVVGFQNQEELQRKFYSFAYRVGKEVLTLPEFTVVTRTCTLEPKTRRIYQQLEDAFYAEVERGEVTVTNALTKIIRLQQVTSGYLKLDDGSIEQIGTEKEALLRDALEDIESDEPVVVVGRFHYDLDTVHRVMNECGRTCAELSGRRDELQAWKDGQFNSICIQLQSGDAGVSVVRAKYMIRYSLDHSLGRAQQIADRIHRPGQTRHTTYIDLVASDSIDVTIARALKNKLDVVEAVLQRRKKEAVNET